MSVKNSLLVFAVTAAIHGIILSSAAQAQTVVSIEAIQLVPGKKGRDQRHWRCR
jgi:hypothetical protein